LAVLNLSGCGGDSSSGAGRHIKRLQLFAFFSLSIVPVRYLPAFQWAAPTNPVSLTNARFHQIMAAVLLLSRVKVACSILLLSRAVSTMSYGQQQIIPVPDSRKRYNEAVRSRSRQLLLLYYRAYFS